MPKAKYAESYMDRIEAGEYELPRGCQQPYLQQQQVLKNARRRKTGQTAYAV